MALKPFLIENNKYFFSILQNMIINRASGGNPVEESRVAKGNKNRRITWHHSQHASQPLFQPRSSDNLTFQESAEDSFFADPKAALDRLDEDYEERLISDKIIKVGFGPGKPGAIFE